MSDGQAKPSDFRQLNLLAAITKELSRQYHERTGKRLMVSTEQMDTIIKAADSVIAAFGEEEAR